MDEEPLNHSHRSRLSPKKVVLQHPKQNKTKNIRQERLILFVKRLISKESYIRRDTFTIRTSPLNLKSPHYLLFISLVIITELTYGSTNIDFLIIFIFIIIFYLNIQIYLVYILLIRKIYKYVKIKIKLLIWNSIM